MSGPTPRLYTELADWWPLLSSPDDYAEEAAFYRRTMVTASRRPLRAVLELGSGGGNNASHFKRHVSLTLVDLSPGMLAVSRALNPECVHIAGDMRDVRLGRRFDAVFVHDAVCYMTTRHDLRRACATAFVHCAPGGVALFAPDHVTERFAPATEHGGHDGADRALRYLAWTWDPDPTDTTYTVDYAFLLRDRDGRVRAETDRHIEGLFPRDAWRAVLEEVGFEAAVVPFRHSEVAHELDLFVGTRPGVGGPATSHGHPG